MQYLHNELKLGFFLTFSHLKLQYMCFIHSMCVLNVVVPKHLWCGIKFMPSKQCYFFSGNANLVILVSRCCILQIFLKGNNGDIFISIHTPSSHSPRLHRGTDLKDWVFQHWLRFTCSVSLYFGTMQSHSILPRCQVPAGQKWPTAWCYTSILLCRYGVLRCGQRELCTFEFCSKALPWSHLTTISFLGLHYDIFFSPNMVLSE